MIELEKLKKDTGRINSALKVMPDNTVVALKKMTCYIPKRFEQSGLAEIGDSVNTIMAVGVVVDDYYSCFGSLTRFSMKPGDTSEEVIKGDRYYVMHFEPGDIVIENIFVPQDANLIYYFYLEFIKYARYPWYMDENVLLNIFDESSYFAGKKVGSSAQVLRVLFSLTMRDPVNLDIPFRYSPQFKDLSVKPRIIGINNPGQLLNSTFSRLSSGYMSDNIVSGILNPDTQMTTLEEVIRGLPEEYGELQ